MAKKKTGTKAEGKSTKEPEAPSLDGLNDPIDLEELATEEAELNAPPPPPLVEGPSVAEEVKPVGRFEYVKYSEHAASVCGTSKKLCEDMEQFIETELPGGRYKSLALTALEEVHTQIGKACRVL